MNRKHPTDVEFTELLLTTGHRLPGPWQFVAFGAGAMYAGFWNDYSWVPLESVACASF